MENWINICEFNKENENTTECFFKILDEEKIPYKKEIKEYWVGKRVPQYEQNIIVYVPEKYKEKVELYLKEYENPNNIVYEAEELKNVSNDEEIEYKSSNIYKKILAYIPIIMLAIVIICFIISGIIME